MSTSTITSQNTDIISAQLINTQEKMKDILLSDEDSKRLNALIEDFIEPYYHRPEGQDYSDWLKNEFTRHAKTWINEDERLQDVKQILNAVEAITDTYRDFREHIDKGKSVESWIANQIEKGAESLGIDTSHHAQSIDEAMRTASLEVARKLGLQTTSVIADGPLITPPLPNTPVPWNDFSRLEIAKNLKQMNLENASLNIASNGVAVLAQQALNTLMDKKQRDFSKNLEEFCTSSLKEAVNTGLGTAVSGALTVFCRNSSSTVVRSIPGGAIASIALGTLDKARILYQAADGTLDPIEALDATANSTCCTAGTIYGGALGSSIGATLGTVFGPIGTAIGAAAGSALGSLAGSKVGQKIYQGGKAVLKTVADGAVKVANYVCEGIKSVGRSVSNFISSFF